jgi:molybdopterin-guanine dinucleotide biosynthesis protein MobB
MDDAARDRRLGNCLGDCPVLALCGYSGSGKTTLLEAVIPILHRRGLSVAVVKHDVHGIELDRAGKDSDRLFRAGADVVLRGPDETLARWHRDSYAGLEQTVTSLLADHDLVLVEGHKRTPLPKIWLCSEGESEPPPGISEVRCVLPWDGDRVDRAEAVMSRRVDEVWFRRPVYGGILIGGRSERMGCPKQLLELAGRTFTEWVASALDDHVEDIALIGAGPVPESLRERPRLPDTPGLQGPVAGLVAALRWHRQAAWLIVACDQPLVRAEAVAWLLQQRAPGRWAVMPRPEGGVVEPLLAVYEHQALSLLEGRIQSAETAPSAISDHSRVECPVPPTELSECWRSVNTPGEYEALRQQ